MLHAFTSVLIFIVCLIVGVWLDVGGLVFVFGCIILILQGCAGTLNNIKRWIKE